MSAPVVHWFRRDLRLRDNSALHAAAASGAPVVPLFILDPALLSRQRVGTARLDFLLKALHALDDALMRYHARLIVRYGAPDDVLPALIAETRAQAVYANRDVSPYARARDERLAQALRVPLHLYDDAYLLPPEAVLKADGKPYVVYTPYRNAWNALPKPSVSELAFTPAHFYSALTPQPIPTLSELGHPPAINTPPADEDSAHDLLNAFIASDLHHYSDKRNDLPSAPYSTPRPRGTSYLSPYLRLGVLSPRHAYWAARQAYQGTPSEAYRESIQTWVSELTWRDFYAQILYHFPHVLERDFVDTYLSLEWRNAPSDLQAWQKGETGYPIVDAPMRQLNAIGWMPNRARMVVASFLTKHLLIHWKQGDIYFMRHLIDGDTASNNGGWQWSAGTGTDAQPYFRIFNPISQSQKFATAAYLRHWLPELASVPDKHVHTPWLAPTPPKEYPLPIVAHEFARQRTLNAFKSARGEKS